MIISIIFLLTFIQTSLQNFLKGLPAISEEHIKDLKNKSKFRIHDFKDHPFRGKSFTELQNYLGILGMNPSDNKISANASSKTNNLLNNKNNFVEALGGDVAALPLDYIVTNTYNKCGSVIKNQGQCASCYAFAVSEVLEDRICIKTNMQTIVKLSPLFMVSTDTAEFGCKGGYLNSSFNYLNQVGTVTSGCFPYNLQANSDGTITVPKWPGYCNYGSNVKFYKALSYSFFRSSDEMKLEIFNNGPIATGFAVYSDFFSYAGGIYELTPGSSFLGGHAVKVIGWGNENGNEYWIAKNSWSTSWGEYGYFRFKINNCCSFDVNGIAALPLI